jgi:hypothetical protein
MANVADVVAETIRVIAKAQRVHKRHVSVVGDKPFYSVDELINVIEELTGMNKIAPKTVLWATVQFKGCLRRYDLNAEIWVGRHKDRDGGKLSTCEQRYVTVKEASHLLIDDKAFFISSTKGLIEGIVFGGSLFDLPQDLRSEFYGEICAMEILFPFKYHEKAISDIGNGALPYDIAKYYMIPEKELLWILSDKIRPFLKICHAKLDELDSLRNPSSSQHTAS